MENKPSIRLKFKAAEPPSVMPCAFDPRPLRITLFPEHPQTILIYVPNGQTLWLPTLRTPFDLDTVSDALDGHDVPHDTREGDRNRWWRNIKQGENDDASVAGNQEREREAALHVKIHLSPDATDFEKQRAEVVLMKIKVDDEIRQLKVQNSHAKARAATLGIYEPQDKFHQREQRLADLQTTGVALQLKLREMKMRQHQHQQTVSNERRFIEKAKRHMTREQFTAIWDEIERESPIPEPARP